VIFGSLLQEHHPFFFQEKTILIIISGYGWERNQILRDLIALLAVFNAIASKIG
jgi:hypothetical protein